MILSHQCSVFEVLRVQSRTDEFLIRTPLVLSTSLAHLPVCVDLVAQCIPQEIFLSLMCIQVNLDLIKRFFRAKVWFVVQEFIISLVVLAHLLLSDLGLKELSVGLVLFLTVLLLEVLHAVHIVER